MIAFTAFLTLYGPQSTVDSPRKAQGLTVILRRTIQRNSPLGCALAVDRPTVLFYQLLIPDPVRLIIAQSFLLVLFVLAEASLKPVYL